jgi:hypothetical protein
MELCCFEGNQVRQDEWVLVDHSVGFFPAPRPDDDHASVVAPLATSLHEDAGREQLFTPLEKASGS